MTPTQEWLARGRVPFIRHFTATTQIDVLDETHAKARSYYLFLTVHGLDHWGRYLDEFAPVDGKWLITHRREMTDAAFAGGWGAGAAAGAGERRGRAPHPATVVLTPGSLRTMTATVGTPSDVDALLEAPLAELMARAAACRDAAHGARITFSPKVFIPLTMLCRDKCGYCTFAKPPAHLVSPYLELDEVLAIARRGAELGCHEALFTLGEAPEDRYPDAAAWLAARGYSSTVDYLVAAAAAVLDRDRPAPPRQRRRPHRGGAHPPPRGVAVAGDDDRDPRRATARARWPARRCARQDTRAPAGDARGRGPGPRAVHHRHPRRHRRDPSRAPRRPPRHPGRRTRGTVTCRR